MRDGHRQDVRDAIAVYAVVALGSVVGGVLRALASSVSLAIWGPGFPVGTLIVNVVGSLIIGFYATLTGPDGRVFASPRQRLLVMAGFCGGFTTFSTFSLETVMLMQSGELLVAAANVAVSVVTWLAAVWLGHMLATRLNRLKGSRP
ncbi:fluoride efflux transporter CrcB [Pseudaminobacter sp. 19-2017]|uniref:Fluoride-specific ion channel FluC n=2 Tax=Pseudaminobacter soli (ex Zhang et al. 2022) TaxID=2831468 RepID=A0A942E5N8_9HYPH|nr:fluoride efflux transporter CrcB [Pseudaminobacter soli]